MKIRLRFTDDKSNKFWTVEVEGTAQTVRHGKLGAAGQSKTKDFPSQEAAVEDAEKQAAKKRKKGYEDCDEAAIAVNKDAVKKAAPKKADPKKAAPKKAAPKKAAPKKAAPKKAAAKKAKAPSSRTLKAFFKAIREMNRERVEKELDGGLDPSLRFEVHGEEPWPALYYACYQRSNELAALLIERGADVTATVGGANALLYVKDAGLAQALIDAGADPNAANKGLTPLHMTDDVDVARVLLDAGAAVDVEDSRGRTPFEATISVPLRDLLVERGAKGLRNTEGAVIEVESEPSSFEHANVAQGSLGVGPDGALWVGGYSGLFRLSGGDVTRFTLPDTPAIQRIVACHGMLYVVTNQGLFRRNGEEWRQFKSNNSCLHENHIVNANVLDDELWCTGYESERKAKHVSVVGRDGWRLLRPGVHLPSSSVAHVWRDANGVLCIADGLGGDGGYHTGEDGNWTHHQLADGTFSPHVYATAVHAGRDYVATHMGLFSRAAGEAEWSKIYAQTFGSMAFVGDDLYGTTGYEGLHILRGGEWLVFDSDKAGVTLNNLEQVVPHPEGGVVLRAGTHLYRVDDDLRFHGLNEALNTPAIVPQTEPEPLPEEPLCDVSVLPVEWVKAAKTVELAGLAKGALVGLVQPAIGVHLADGVAAVGGSKLGGLPDLPADMAWPLHPEDEDSLPFLMQLNVAELAPFDVASRLPKSGRVYFFCDTSAEGEDSVVLYSNEQEVFPRPIPEDLEGRGGQDLVASFSEKALCFQTQFTLPSNDWMRLHGMQEEAQDELEALREALCAHSNFVETQVLGWPEPVQGDFLVGADSVALLQLARMDEQFGNFILDGLRFWIIEIKDLRSASFGRVFTEYQYT